MSIAGWALRRPLLLLGSTGLLTLLLGLGIFALEIRTDGATIYPLNDPVVELTQQDRHTFRDPEQIILLLSSRRGGPEVASTEGLREIAVLHRELDRLPAVRRGRVRSLASLPDPPEELTPISVVGRFLDEIPESPAAVAILRERIRRHPFGNGLFLAADGRAAAFYVPLAEGQSRSELIADVESWLASRKERGFDLRLTGPGVAEAVLGRAVLRDLAWLAPLMAATIAVLLIVSLRTLAAVAITLVEVILVLVWTFGAMGHLGVPVTLVTTVLPVILLAMAVVDEIHFLERLQARLARADARDSGPPDRVRVRAATEEVLDQLRRPIVLTSLTTAVGFFSLPLGTIEPLRQFGIFAGCGILLAMVFSFTVVPAVAVVLPPWLFRPLRLPLPSADPSRVPFEAWLARHESATFFAGVAIVLLCVPGLLRLSVQDSWLDNFDPASPLALAENDFNARFWGTYRFDAVFTGQDAGFFRRLEGIELIESFSESAASGPRVGGVLSYLAPLRVVGEIAGKPGKLSSLDARDRSTVLALGMMLRGALDLDPLVTRDARSARVRIFVNSPDYAHAVELRDHLQRRAAPLLAAAGAEVHFSGDLPVAIQIVKAIVGNQLRSIGWTLAGVMAVVLLAFRSLRTAVIVSTPVTAAALVVLGAMGYAGLPLGIASSMFAALAVASGVDFAIHVWNAYERRMAEVTEVAEVDGHATAVSAALSMTARAIRWNAVVLALGFLVLTASTLKPNRILGLLLAGAILAAYGATMLLLPRLLRR